MVCYFSIPFIILKSILYFFVSDRQPLKKEEERLFPQPKSPLERSSPAPAEGNVKVTTSCEPGSTQTRPHRFISSILGGDIPYRGHHILTSAEKKEYLPVEKRETSSPSPPPPRCQPVSVIQRTPVIPPAKPHVKQETPMIIQEPEQDQPIDYHVPKKESDNKEDEPKRKQFAIAIKRGHVLLAGRTISSGGMILMAAAGHSRNGGGGSNSRGHQGGGSNGSSQGSSSGNSYSSSGGGGLSSGSGGGAMGGTGGGGLNPGGNGKSNYGPNSPPTGSLPPFYESLKSGGLPGYPHQYGSQYQSMMSSGPLPMDCDTGQEISGSNYNSTHNDILPKQYSLLQNVCATYGITVKDDEDLSSYVKDSGGFLSYDDVMVDAVTGAVVDPLQFTATLTFSSPADHTALLESLSDAADLFLRDVSYYWIHNYSHEQ